MSFHHGHNLDGYRDPRFEGPSFLGFMLWVAVVVVCVAILAAAVCSAAEPARATLFIYTAHDDTDEDSWCGPCNLLHKAFQRPESPLSKFKVVRLAPPDGCVIPCIYYRDAQGKWAKPFVGWDRKAEGKFLERYRRDTQTH